MKNHYHKHRPCQPRGLALAAVLWLILILSFTIIAAIKVVSYDLDVSLSGIHGFRAKQMAEMGIAVGANPLVERSDPLLKMWSESDDEGYDVTLTTEGAKFNINSILMGEDKILLSNMFMEWGMDVDMAGEVVDCLVDWVDRNDEESLNGAEVGWYEERGRLNQPFNRPFYDVAEMRLVKGMDLVETLRPDWESWFTIWSSGSLDINEASAEMIAVAAEVSVEEADLIPETVRGPDGIRDTEDDAPFASAEEALALLGLDGSLRPDIVSRFGVNDTATRIESIGVAAGAKRKITVVVRNRTGQPAVLERYEEVIP